VDSFGSKLDFLRLRALMDDQFQLDPIILEN